MNDEQKKLAGSIRLWSFVICPFSPKHMFNPGCRRLGGNRCGYVHRFDGPGRRVGERDACRC